MKKATSPRDQLFETAARLFYRDGYRATGVDTIAAESGIGKMTLYRHYPSKDDLIVAYLQVSNRDFWGNFEAVTEDAPTARDELLAFFQALQDYVVTPACYGCPFLNVATEFPGADHPGHQVAVGHKEAVRARFRRLAKQAGSHRPKALADSLFLLMDGAYMAARMFGSSPDNPAAHVAEAARRLIDCDLEATGSKRR
jgi:AcrR family transcriptional regulator